MFELGSGVGLVWGLCCVQRRGSLSTRNPTSEVMGRKELCGRVVHSEMDWICLALFKVVHLICALHIKDQMYVRVTIYKLISPFASPLSFSVDFKVFSAYKLYVRNLCWD